MFNLIEQVQAFLKARGFLNHAVNGTWTPHTQSGYTSYALTANHPPHLAYVQPLNIEQVPTEMRDWIETGVVNQQASDLVPDQDDLQAKIAAEQERQEAARVQAELERERQAQEAAAADAERQRQEQEAQIAAAMAAQQAERENQPADQDVAKQDTETWSENPDQTQQEQQQSSDNSSEEQ